MKFTCDSLILFEACSTVAKYVPQKSTIPALDGLLFRINGNTLKIYGYDMEVGIETEIDIDTVEAEENEGFILNSKMINDILRNIDPGIVRIFRRDKHTIGIEGGGSDYNIPSMDASLFPEMPSIQTDKTITFKQSVLLSMIRQTIFAVAVTSTKPVLLGAFFDIKKDGVSVVCSDTYKLAIRNEKMENSEEFSFVVPGRVLTELIKIIKNTDDEIKISLSAKHIVFEFGKTVITSRLLEGQYLNYKSIIPKSFGTKVNVNVKEFRAVTERASVIIKDKFKVPIRCTFDLDSIVITCQTEDHRFTDEISAKAEGEPLEIGVNNKYLSEVLDACESERALIQMNTALSSICVTPEGSDSFICLLSPLRIK